MKTYRIKEIFGPTIQGEGSRSGTVVMFLRFAGCNRWTGLDKDREKSICRFCDTDFRGGEPMTAEQIGLKLKETSQVKVIVISGGEATLQLDSDLLKHLTSIGYKLHLETNGSKTLGSLVNYFDHITMSPKQSVLETKLELADDIKILYPPISQDVTLENFNEFPARNKFLQAVWDKYYEANLRATICRIYGNPEWKLSLQTHKIIGVQ